MVLNRDFSEFVSALDAHDVRYLVVGGYAVAFHGHPRYTKDLDVWVESTSDNAIRLLAALEQFGFGSLDLRTEDFLAPDTVIQLGYPPARIDLLTSMPGVDFTGCHDRRVEVEMGGVPVRFIGLVDLKANKQASGRHQDLADLENLQ